MSFAEFSKLIDTFLDVVVEKNFSLLLVGCHLFRVVNGDRYLPRGNSGNVFVARWVIPLVTMPPLDFVMIREFI